MSNFESIEFQFSNEPGELVALWFWDYACGNDVCGDVLSDGTVLVNTYNENGDENGTEKISLIEFLNRIKKSIESREMKGVAET